MPTTRKVVPLTPRLLLAEAAAKRPRPCFTNAMDCVGYVRRDCLGLEEEGFLEGFV